MKVVISGYGKMGHIIETVLINKGIEAIPTEDVVSTDPAVAGESICIDFTTPDAFRANYKYIAEHFKAAVIGTTGWDDIRAEVTAYFEKCGTPMIWGSNFSIGVIAMSAAVDCATKILQGAGYVPFIEETHHVHKVDSPSGTAKSLSEVIEHNLGVRPDITSIRQGEVAGTHIVKLKSEVDKIKITHEAFSREGFAQGAVKAAEMLEELKGVHEFKELIINRQ